MRTFSLNDRDAQILNSILGGLNYAEMAKYVNSRNVDWRPLIKETPVSKEEVRHVIEGIFVNTMFK
jgi:hypothetical protein